MFGMEIETSIPIDIKTQGDTYATIAEDEAGIFHIDVDYRRMTDDRRRTAPILEFIMHAYDDHEGDLAAALAEFGRRYTAVRDAIEAFAAAKAGSSFSEICEQLKIRPNAIARDARISGQDLGPRLKGPVHYTVGFALSVIPRLINEKLGDPESKKRSKRRAAQANVVGAAVTAVPAPDVDRTKMHAYVALLYMQVAAKFDGAKFPGRKKSVLDKNRAEAFCRVPMDVIHGHLQPTEKAWLTKENVKIIQEMQKTYHPPSKCKPKDKSPHWGHEHKNDGDLTPPLVKPLFDGAFTGRPTDLRKLFGEMTIVPRAEPVGRPAQNGYALELRHVAREQGDLQRVYDEAVQCITYDRHLHGTPVSAPAPAPTVVVATSTTTTTTSTEADPDDTPPSGTSEKELETKT